MREVRVGEAFEREASFEGGGRSEGLRESARGEAEAGKAEAVAERSAWRSRLAPARREPPMRSPLPCTGRRHAAS